MRNKDLSFFITIDKMKGLYKVYGIILLITRITFLIILIIIKNIVIDNTVDFYKMNDI